MTDPLRDHIRAALDYDVIIRDALATVPNSAINDLVERLAEGMATPKPKRDPLTDPRPGDVVRYIGNGMAQCFTLEVTEADADGVSLVGLDPNGTWCIPRNEWSDWTGFTVEVLHTAPDEVTP